MNASNPSQPPTSHTFRRFYRKFCRIKIQASDALDKWAGRLGIATLLIAVLTGIAIWQKNETFLFIAMIISSIMAIITYYSGIFFAGTIQDIAKTIHGTIGTTTATIAKELEKIFHPLCVVSMITTFIGFWAVTAGFDSVSGQNLMVVIGLTAFFSYLGVYQGTKTKWVGIILTPIIILMTLFYWIRTSETATAEMIRTNTGLAKADMQGETLKKSSRGKLLVGMVVVENATSFQLKDTVGIAIKLMVKNTNILPRGTQVNVLVKASKEFQKNTGKSFILANLLDKDGIPINDTLYFVPGTLDWGKSDYRPGAYASIESDGFKHILFLTDDPVNIPTENLYGKTVDFPPFNEGELKINNIGEGKFRHGVDDTGMDNVPPGCRKINLKRKACTLQAHKGFFLTLSYYKP
jgi:hypothetical protein